MAVGDPVPPPLRWAARLLLVEAVAVVVVVAALAYGWLRETTADPVGSVAVLGYAAIMAAALAGVSVLLSRRKPRARAPALVLQLLGVVVAYYLASAGIVWLGLVVTAMALLVITLLLLPATTAALTS